MGDPSDALALLSDPHQRKAREEIADTLSVQANSISRWETRKFSPPAKAASALKDAASQDARLSRNGGVFTCIDLFAGIGGIRLGFERHGARCIFTSEWNKWSQETYGANFGSGHPIAGDITKVDASEIPDHDVLLAGRLKERCFSMSPGSSPRKDLRLSCSRTSRT
jgi:DNA (cytosine-5)-methyltransferase 1